MKKRIVSILLTLCMVLCLVPTAAFAAGGIDYGFTINGTAVTSENIGSLPGVTGTVSYDQATKTLTLDGVTITSSARSAIDCSSGVDAIKLVGANEILFTAEAADVVKNPWIYGIYQGYRDKVLTVFGSSRSDSLKITVPKRTEHTLNREYPANCIYVSNNLEIRSCTLDILNPEILYGGSFSPLLYSQNGNITIKDCDLKAVLGKDHSGEINKVPIGRIVCAMLGDITITDSKVEAGVFSSSEGGTFAAIDGNNITVTGSELDLKVKVAANGDCSVRALHIDSSMGKINLIDSFGTIEVGSSNQCKCFGIDIWPGAENECLTIDACTLTINILGTNMTREKEQAILILDDSDTATNKWPIFKNISAFTYGDTADNTVTKAPGSTETGFWRKHYLKITAAPTALTLDKTALELATGSTGTLTATVSPAHAEQNVTWTSSNESVATVENGVVTAVRAGTATITASASGLSASCTVTVKDPIYSVTLHTDGGTIEDGKNVTSYTYGVGAALPTADDMTYTGHTFKGWYDNEGLAGDPVTSIGDTETGTKEYWASWDANTYTVTLHTNGGAIDNGNVTGYTYGVGATLPTAEDMTYTGHTFKGWYDNDGLTGSPVTAIGDTETGTKEYWAKWDANTYTVTLNTGGATISSGNVTGYTYGAGAALPTAEDMIYTGHTFMGWYDNEGLAGDPVTAIGNTETGDKKYWASWEINTYIITVKPENDDLDIHITGYYGDPISAPTLIRDGYEFIGWDKAFPTTMPAENMTITAQWRDIAAPTGEIKIAENGWKSFLNTITFGLFFKDTQTVTLTAADNSGEAVTIEYLLSDKALTESELAGMTFAAYSAPFNIDPDNEYVTYAKLTDTSGNAAYINTNGIVLDATVPVISGIEAGKTYCAAQTVTVTEKYIDTVKVNGTEVSLDENGQFVLSPASGEQTIVVTDKAGNEARITVTVNNGHTGGTATCKDKANCEICGESYGELDSNNHADMKHIAAKAATKTAEGNIEYWFCDGCGKYFADKDGNKKITKADTVTAKLPEEKPTSPKTGDTSNLALWITLLFVSSGVITGVIVAGKKKKQQG